MMARYICTGVFVLLVFLSPLSSEIFTLDFPKNFVLGILDENGNKLAAPILIMPLTELSESICGRQCADNAEVSIFVDDRENPRYVIKADENGVFCKDLDGQYLKPGSRLWVKQKTDKKESRLSATYQILDSKMISWYMEKEKHYISSLKNCINILLSWSVVIIGGIIYLTLKKRQQVHLLFLLIPIFFLYVLSIYFGFSCNVEINGAIANAIPVSTHQLIDELWWKQIQLFQQAIFLSAIFVLWNLLGDEGL